MALSYPISRRSALPSRGLLATLVAALALSLVATPLSARAVTAGGELVGIIVREQHGAGDAPERAVARIGGTVGLRLGIIGGFSAKVPSGAVSLLSRTPGVLAVSADRSMRPLDIDDAEDDVYGSMFNTTRSIGAQAMWQSGFTGKGIGIALIDTGVAPVNGLKTTGKVVNGPDLSFDSQADHLRYLDMYGHGTHMAGIMAGKDSDIPSDAYSAPSKNKPYFLGIAPEAHVVNVKIGAADGGSDVSQAIAAIDWVVQHRDDPGMNIRVLNLSFGTDSTQSYQQDPLAYAAEIAWHKGIVVVAAAGNEGFGTAKLNDPAYDPYVIAVAASDMNDSLRLTNDTTPDFSSRGDASRRPDFSAPGQSTISLRVPGSYADTHYPSARVGDRFFKGSGTSQAAAVVSGAVALLLHQRPNMTPDQIKRLIKSTAAPMPFGDPDGRGAGEINLRAAMATGTPNAVQTHPRSTGLGSLDAARGTVVINDEGVALRGEKTIFGTSWDPAAWAQRAADETSWVGGSWMGLELTGDGWGATSWAGRSWSGRSWSGRSWSGRSWSGRSWSGRSWSGGGWTGDSWLGRSWSSDSWTGRSWSSGGWLGITWGNPRKHAVPRPAVRLR